MTVHTRANLLSELSEAADREAFWETVLADPAATARETANATQHVMFWRRKRTRALLALHKLDNEN